MNQTQRFTAADAMKLVNTRTVDQKIDSLLESIKLLAEDKCTGIKTGWQHNHDLDLWALGGFNNTDEWVY